MANSESPESTMLITEPSENTVLITEPSENTVLITEPPESTVLITEPPESTVLITEPPESTVLITEPSESTVLITEPPESTVLITEPSENTVLINDSPEDQDEQELPELRIVLFGRTTVGKSTLGGLMVGDRTAFTSNDPPGDRTKTCRVERTDTGRLSVAVVDTPGLFKMGRSDEEVLREIKWSIESAEPGPHIFLLVERLKIITSEELKVLEVFQCTFGQRATAYAMVVFTCKSDLRGGEVDIKVNMTENDLLRELIERCQWRYFIFNIADRSPVQVTELLEKITQMRKDYSEFFYTPQMLREAERDANEEQREEHRKRKATEDRLALLEKSGLIGVFLGSVVGYFSCGGELTPTTGALLGALLGMIVIMGITFSCIPVIEKSFKK